MTPARSFCSTVAWLVTALMLLWVGSCDVKPKPAINTRLHVLAAASLADAFREIGVEFKKSNPEIEVDFSFAGSNQLRTQLENGGPGDVFASADHRQMDLAQAAKAVVASTVRVFARNRLAIIVPRENLAGIRGLPDLARPGLKVVVADGNVPAGNYARLMFEKAARTAAYGPAFRKSVEANIVSREENIAAVVAKVALNEADAGIAYASDAVGGNGPRLTVLPLPDNLEQQAEYSAAITARTTNGEAAARFVEFLSSTEAALIFVKRGFTGPDAGSH